MDKLSRAHPFLCCTWITQTCFYTSSAALTLLLWSQKHLWHLIPFSGIFVNMWEMRERNERWRQSRQPLLTMLLSFQEEQYSTFKRELHLSISHSQQRSTPPTSFPSLTDSCGEVRWRVSGSLKGVKGTSACLCTVCIYIHKKYFSLVAAVVREKLRNI